MGQKKVGSRRRLRITTSRLRLYPPDFLNTPFVQPPLEEQRGIVRVLDWHGAQVSRLVRAKRRLVGLLNEQKQAIIHRAVTRGLNPDAPLKPSGIDWLGDIPAHWEVRRLKTFVRFTGGGTPTKSEERYWNGSIPWVSPKDMKAHIVNETEDYISEVAVAESSTKIVPKGSVLMVVRSGILQRTIPVALAGREVALNQDMKAVSFNERMLPEFFVRLVFGCEPQLLREWTKQGATVESIEHQFLADSKLPLPPVEEQEAILVATAESTNWINTAITQIQSEIALIQEYRTRLIADVVTGRLDVRALAADLPDTAPEALAPDTDDEAEDLMDADEAQDAEAAA